MKAVSDQRGPSPIDVHVGARLKERRISLEITQEELGSVVGLTFQQIQKYERGANRISGSRLYEFAQCLDVPITWFFADIPASVEAHYLPIASALEGVDLGLPADLREDTEVQDLVRAYYKVESPQVRTRLYDMAKVLAKGGGDR